VDEEAMFLWWKDCYMVDGLCGLCGQIGIIHTEVASPAGIPCGGYFFCVCPNGQKLRECSGVNRPSKEFINRLNQLRNRWL
jgi:hypothetical protein